MSAFCIALHYGGAEIKVSLSSSSPPINIVNGSEKHAVRKKVMVKDINAWKEDSSSAGEKKANDIITFAEAIPSKYTTYIPMADKVYAE